jgi:hypothetical protein
MNRAHDLLVFEDAADDYRRVVRADAELGDVEGLFADGAQLLLEELRFGAARDLGRESLLDRYPDRILARQVAYARHRAVNDEHTARGALGRHHISLARWQIAERAPFVKEPGRGDRSYALDGERDVGTRLGGHSRGLRPGEQFGHFLRPVGDREVIRVEATDHRFAQDPRHRRDAGALGAGLSSRGRVRERFARRGDDDVAPHHGVRHRLGRFLAVALPRDDLHQHRFRLE